MRTLSLVITFVVSNIVYGQKYISEKSEISFFSKALIEDITATTTKSTSAIDIESGKVAFSVPIRSFDFRKKLMKEHFNNKYMETDEYPKSTFVGEIEGFDKRKEGKQSARAKGELTIHGVEKDINVEGWIEFRDNKLYLESTFIVKLEDYKIKIPQVLWQNIAEEMEVKIHFDYVPYD